MAKVNKKTKVNKKNLIVFIFLLIWIIIFIYSGIRIFIWYRESQNAKSLIAKINQIADIAEISDYENVKIINGCENEKNIKINLLDVDISRLKKMNPDTVGWIQVNGTDINYPIVQTYDNNYYLEHSFDRKESKAGWVFADYRNDMINLDKNTIIYAHNREDKIMFNSLKNVLKQEWFNNAENQLIKLSTEKENSLWQIFSVYHIKTTDDYTNIYFKDDNEYVDFLNKIKNRSAYDFQVDVGKDDRIITLSTCYNRSERLVVHAKKIKYELK